MPGRRWRQGSSEPSNLARDATGGGPTTTNRSWSWSKPSSRRRCEPSRSPQPPRPRRTSRARPTRPRANPAWPPTGPRGERRRRRQQLKGRPPQSLVPVLPQPRRPRCTQWRWARRPPRRRRWRHQRAGRQPQSLGPVPVPVPSLGPCQCQLRSLVRQLLSSRSASAEALVGPQTKPASMQLPPTGPRGAPWPRGLARLDQRVLGRSRSPACLGGQARPRLAFSSAARTAARPTRLRPTPRCLRGGPQPGGTLRTGRARARTRTLGSGPPLPPRAKRGGGDTQVAFLDAAMAEVEAERAATHRAAAVAGAGIQREVGRGLGGRRLRAERGGVRDRARARERAGPERAPCGVSAGVH